MVKAKETVVCADCENTVPVFQESRESYESLASSGFDGKWADCPDCGVTGIHDEKRFGAPKPRKSTSGTSGAYPS